jgi:cold shock protein
MTILGKIVTSVFIAAVASTVTTLLLGKSLPDVTLLAAFTIATLATAFLTTISRPVAIASSPATTSAEKPPKTATKKKKAKPTGDRTEGEVKWFNISKGFGFITQDNGEEIFVHFRSILGEGRRGLRDGQRVAFRVAQSDKGPQAEDVEPLD